jgi:hypothetical protein
MISGWWLIGKDAVGSGRPTFKVLSQHSPRGTEENDEKLNQDSRSSGPRIEPGSSRIRSRSVNHSTTMFGASLKTRALLFINWHEINEVNYKKTLHRRFMERHCRVVNTPASYSEGPGFKSRSCWPAILIKVSMVFLSPSRRIPG